MVAKFHKKIFSKRTIIVLLFIVFQMGTNTVFSQEKNSEELSFKGLTFQPGYRIQTRYAYYESSNTNDIMIRRVRLKANGDVFGMAKYYVELKIDNTAQEGKTPKAKIEAAYLDFKLYEDVYLKVGQYDVPFTRSLLTSDSKLLIMDRSIVTDKLANLGLVDNTQGLLFYGRPMGGHLEYSLGVFDNEVFELANGQTSKWSKSLMTAGRLALNLFDKESKPSSSGYADYRASYVGKGKRLSLGVNAVQLKNVNENNSQYNLSAIGADIYANYKSFSFEAEYDKIEKDINGYGWYTQIAYLLPVEFGNKFKIEPNLRYQEYDNNKDIVGDRVDATSIGLNFYFKGHNLKAQMDYTMYGEETNKLDNNIFQIQLQLDF